MLCLYNSLYYHMQPNQAENMNYAMTHKHGTILVILCAYEHYTKIGVYILQNLE